MLSIHYFASVREALGRESEQLALPDNVHSVAELTRFLAQRDDAFARLLQGEQALLVAVNQTVANAEQPLSADDEVAFFPPMTGG